MHAPDRGDPGASSSSWCSIDETKIDGDTRDRRRPIAAQGAERPQTLTLEKEDGDWKLSAGAAGS